MNLLLHPEHPGAAIEAAFTRIGRERMEGLPIVNPALRVQAIGFRPWNDHWLGVLVTPWAMSVMLLPAEADAWIRVGEQERRFVAFPYGQLAFLSGEEAGLGEYQTCSLFSPMDRFASHEDACEVARASLAALLAAPPQAPAAPLAEAASPVAVPPPRAELPSRRRFLGLGA